MISCRTSKGQDPSIVKLNGYNVGEVKEFKFPRINCNDRCQERNRDEP